MNTFLKFGALAGAALLAIAPTLPALAAPPPDVFKDAAGNVYVHGTTAAGLASDATASTSEDLVRRVRAGFCNEIRISTSSTLPDIGDSWTVGGTTRTRAALVTITDPDLLPSCRSANWNPTLTAAITTAGGFIDNTVAGRDRVTLLNGVAGTSSEVTFNDVAATQRLRPNACGFVRISNTATNPVPASLTIGGTSYTVASLTTAVAPRCYREGSNYVFFEPSTWN